MRSTPDNFDKEAIVLDVRFNGGGFTHDQVLNYLGGKEHTFFRQREGGEGWCCAPSTANGPSRWSCSSTTAPTAMPRFSRSAFRTLGLGKLVGQPTGGHVIGTTQHYADRRLDIPHATHRRLHA